MKPKPTPKPSSSKPSTIKPWADRHKDKVKKGK